MDPAGRAPFHVMAKPAGPRCNIACDYCYYLSKDGLYPEIRKFRMSEDVLERYISEHIAAHQALGLDEVTFGWQGGEPTMLGLDFFETVVRLQDRHRPDGFAVHNALQTNGMLLDAGWAGFLRDHRFLVGISIDGPRHIHDRYRRDRAGRPSFRAVMAGLDLLQRHQVEFNALTVVNRNSALHPREIYEFLRGAGVEHMQFIPVVERRSGTGALAAPPQIDGGAAPDPMTQWSVRPAAYGRFLCTVFDLWRRRDIGRVFVQFIEDHLRSWSGLPSGLCVFAETCGGALALEQNGDLYACDHYVYPEFRLGNLATQPLADMVWSDRQQEFGRAKRDSLPRQCLGCAYRFACNGGCPKHRLVETGEPGRGLNYLCPAYRQFFGHAGPELRAMARELALHGAIADRRGGQTNPGHGA